MLLAPLVDDLAVEAAEIDELSASAEMAPSEVAACNAGMKADVVAARHPEDWVIGADTIVVLDGVIYGKPADLKEAAMFLQRFSGREHEVITAVALRRYADRRCYDFTTVSQVRFRNLSCDCIEKYLSLVPVLDKAGAYGIQEYGKMLVESISGELENIIGLPVESLKRAFEMLQIDFKR